MNDERGTMNEELSTAQDDARADLRKRTKSFALRIIKLYSALPKTTPAQVLG